jgi:hypothetical protein
MNYLQLCQNVCQEVGINEIPSVTGQTGDAARIVNWVKNAWLEVQGASAEWNFLWKRVAFDSTAGVKQYTPAVSDVNVWDTQYFTLFKKSEGESTETALIVMPHHEFKREDVGTHDNQRPTHLIVVPNGDLILYPTPDDVYTVQLAYWKHPVELAANTDTPAIPSYLHSMIVDKAMEYYAAYEEAPNVYQGAATRYQQKLNRLLRMNSPLIALGETPLA